MLPGGCSLARTCPSTRQGIPGIHASIWGYEEQNAKQYEASKRRWERTWQLGPKETPPHDPPNLFALRSLCSLPSPTCLVSTQISAPCKGAGIYAYRHTSSRYSKRPVHARGHTQLGMTADTQLHLPSLCLLPFTPDLFSASPNRPRLPWEAEVTLTAGWL